MEHELDIKKNIINELYMSLDYINNEIEKVKSGDFSLPDELLKRHPIESKSERVKSVVLFKFWMEKKQAIDYCIELFHVNKESKWN